jgi:hypothetical protein
MKIEVHKNNTPDFEALIGGENEISPRSWWGYKKKEKVLH